jgi:hypothetical protein
VSEALTAVLRDLVQHEGSEFLEDRGRLEAALRARAPNEGRAIHLLLVGRDAGLPERFRRLAGRVDAADIEASTSDLVERFGVAEAFARAAVETWAEAMGPSGSDAPVARRPDAEGGTVPDGPEADRKQAGQRPHGAPRSTDDRDASLGTPAVRVPRENEVGTSPPGGQESATDVFRLDLTLLGERRGPAPAAGGRPAERALSPSPTETDEVPPPSQSAPMHGRSAERVRFGSRRALLGLAALILAACGIGAVLVLVLGRGTDPSPTRQASDAGAPAPAKPVTPEGYPVLSETDRPTLAAKLVEGRPETLLVTFGVRQGADVLTYQAAADFSRGDEAGIGLLRVFKDGQESATEPKRLVRRLESDGHRGFTLSGALAGPVSAPGLCVTILTRTMPSEAGRGHLCAFAARPDGACAAETRLGCAILQP